MLARFTGGSGLGQVDIGLIMLIKPSYTQVVVLQKTISISPSILKKDLKRRKLK